MDDMFEVKQESTALKKRWNMQFDGGNHRVVEANDLIESEYYVGDERTSIEDFVNEFMTNGTTPIERQFFGLVNDVPEPVTIYPSVTDSFNVGGRYSEEEQTAEKTE